MTMQLTDANKARLAARRNPISGNVEFYAEYTDASLPSRYALFDVTTVPLSSYSTMSPFLSVPDDVVQALLTDITHLGFFPQEAIPPSMTQPERDAYAAHIASLHMQLQAQQQIIDALLRSRREP